MSADPYVRTIHDRKEDEVVIVLLKRKDGGKILWDGHEWPTVQLVLHCNHVKGADANGLAEFLAWSFKEPIRKWLKVAKQGKALVA